MRSSLTPRIRSSARFGAPICGLLFTLLILSSCGRSNLKVVHQPAPSEVVVVKQGPPPHAPAHGYRHKHEGKVELCYDSALQVYVVTGHKDCWFRDQSYFRLVKGSWEMSLSYGGPWTPAPAKSLPPGLAKKYGHGPAKKNQSKKK
jgi:hypothetical protein